jgi:hypothetical protein
MQSLSATHNLSRAPELWIEDEADVAGSLLLAWPKGTQRAGLKLEKMYFPLGFPVRIVTNHASVLAAADRSWSSFMPVFHRPPLEILVEVREGPVAIPLLPPAPRYSLKENLMVQEADAQNFIVADLRLGRAVGRVTEMTARCLSYFRYHFLEGTALAMLATLHCVPIHGACVRVAGKGILICGDSGDGKSTLAFAGARAGWTYVSDDATYLPIERNDRLVVGNCHQIRFRPSAAQLFPELTRRRITPRASGKPSIEVPTSEWPDILCANAAFIDSIVFLNRRSADEQRLIPLRASTVWGWFKQHLIILRSESSVAQEAALARLLTASVFELRYRDLPWGIDRLQQLAVNGV